MSREFVHKGHTKYDEDTLSTLFFREIRNERMAWYIDYFTEDPEQFGVRYLAEGANDRVWMTNEKKDKRDPNDCWGSNDVITWFSQDNTEHRWMFFFRTSQGDLWGLHVEANLVFAFGPDGLSLPAANLWDEYVTDGILGPLRMTGFDGDKQALEAIVVDPDLHGELDKFALLDKWLFALAGILDE